MRKYSRRIALVAAIVYFSQGALGIASIALPLYLRSLGWSIAEITAISSFAAFPWVLKIIYGLISDSLPLFGYRRKSYLVLSSVIAAIGWLALVLMPPTKAAITFAMSLSNFGFAFTDVVTDGLIVEHSTVRSSPVYQGIAWGFRCFGTVVSGITGGWLASRWPPQQVFLLTLALPLGVAFFALSMSERKILQWVFEKPSAPFRKCFKLLLDPNLRWFVAILLVAGLPSSFGMPFFFHMKETLGFSETFLGSLISLGWGGGILASLVFVRWLRRVSPKTVLTWAIIFNCVNILSTLLIYDKISALCLVFLGGIMGVLTMLPIMSSAATLTHGSFVESTLFAVLMSLFNLSQIAFGYLGGKLHAVIGIQALIIISGLLSLIGLLFVRKLEIKPYAAHSPQYLLAHRLDGEAPAETA